MFIMNTPSFLLRLLVCLSILAGAVSCSLIDEDYTPFNTDPTIKMTAPKVRVLNLNFKQGSIQLSIGGKRYQNDLKHRQLTAYEETTATMLGDSVVEVFDGEGNLLTKTKLDVSFGSNYTFAVIPAYRRVMSKFMLSNSERERWMIKARTDSAVLVIIPDPVLPPIPDRSSTRFVALALDQAQSHRLFVEPLWLYNANPNPEFGTYIQYFPLTLPLEGFPGDPGFHRYDPPRYQIGQYYPFDAQRVSVYSPGKISFGMEYESGQAPPVTTQPFNFEAGKSYTIITNGTHGLVGDSSEPTAENVAKPLEPIPYELFILHDEDQSARTLVPESQHRMSDLSANINFLHLNTAWRSSAMCLSIDGAVYRPDQQARNDYASIFIHQTSLTGKRKLGAVAAGTVRPTIVEQEFETKIGGYYMTFFYAGEDGAPKLKTVEQDTTFAAGKLRVNISHFSSDLGEVRVLNDATGEVLIPSLSFEHISRYIELPINVSPGYDTNYPLNKKVDALRVVKASDGETLFNLNLSYYDFNYMADQLVVDGSRFTGSGMMNYSVVLSGKYHDPAIGFSKTVLGGGKGEVKTTADGPSDIYYSYVSLYY
jgi:hypothetical protein